MTIKFKTFIDFDELKNEIIKQLKDDYKQVILSFKVKNNEFDETINECLPIINADFSHAPIESSAEYVIETCFQDFFEDEKLNAIAAICLFEQENIDSESYPNEYEQALNQGKEKIIDQLFEILKMDSY